MQYPVINGVATEEMIALDAKVRGALCKGPPCGPGCESIDEAAQRIIRLHDTRPIADIWPFPGEKVMAARILVGDGDPWDRMRAAAKMLDGVE